MAPWRLSHAVTDEQEDGCDQERDTQKPTVIKNGEAAYFREKDFGKDVYDQCGQGGNKEQSESVVFDGMPDHVEPIGPEDNNDRDQGSYMKENVQHFQCGAVCLNTEQNPGQQKMPAGGNREKFAQALKKAEEDGGWNAQLINLLFHISEKLYHKTSILKRNGETGESRSFG